MNFPFTVSIFVKIILYFGSTKPYLLIQIQNNLKNKLSSIHVNFIPLVLFNFICNSLLDLVFISDIIELSAMIIIKYVKHILVGLNDIHMAY